MPVMLQSSWSNFQKMTVIGLHLHSGMKPKPGFMNPSMAVFPTYLPSNNRLSICKFRSHCCRNFCLLARVQSRKVFQIGFSQKPILDTSHMVKMDHSSWMIQTPSTLATGSGPMENLNLLMSLELSCSVDNINEHVEN